MVPINSALPFLQAYMMHVKIAQMTCIFQIFQGKNYSSTIAAYIFAQPKNITYFIKKFQCARDAMPMTRPTPLFLCTKKTREQNGLFLNQIIGLDT